MTNLRWLAWSGLHGAGRGPNPYRAHLITRITDLLDGEMQ